MILVSALSVSCSFQAISHLALHMLFIFPSWYDMQGAAHIMMTLDIAINFWLTDSYLGAMK